MFVDCFIYILMACICSFLLCLLGCSISWLLQGYNTARELFYSYVMYFNGILVAGIGYGLMFFIKKNGKKILNTLNNAAQINQEYENKLIIYSYRATSWKWSHIISIPVTLIGGAILWFCGYPLNGFAKYFLFISSASLYYVGGFMFSFFWHTLLSFKLLEEINQHAMHENKHDFNILETESLNTFFIITSTIGTIGLFLAFRGTLTANFVRLYDSSLMYDLLIFPIILFLPAPLLYSFYPRYILNRMYDYSLISKIKALESQKDQVKSNHDSLKNKLEMEKILLDIKDRLIIERSKLSIFNIKDSFSLLLIILAVVQIIIAKDKIVIYYLQNIFGNITW